MPSVPDCLQPIQTQNKFRIFSKFYCPKKDWLRFSQTLNYKRVFLISSSHSLFNCRCDAPFIVLECCSSKTVIKLFHLVLLNSVKQILLFLFMSLMPMLPAGRRIN